MNIYKVSLLTKNIIEHPFPKKQKEIQKENKILVLIMLAVLAMLILTSKRKKTLTWYSL